MRNATLYYNPKCGTCRKVLEALKAKGIRPRLVEYLKTPPDESELDLLLKKLRMEPQGPIRTKEKVYQDHFADKQLSRREWIKALHEYPVLIERPILALDDRAGIIRPAEKLDAFL